MAIEKRSSPLLPERLSKNVPLTPPDSSSPKNETDTSALHFTGPMAAVVVGFFESRTHAKRFKELGITLPSAEFAEKAYDLADENLSPETSRAQLRLQALETVKKLATLSPEKRMAWLDIQDKEVQDVIAELIDYVGAMIDDDNTLRQVIEIARRDVTTSVNQRGNRLYN